jgi:hypothetical protein
MSCFPLYDNISAQKKGKRCLMKEEKKRLIDNIARLDQDGQHKVMAIIIYYQKENGIRCLKPAATVNISLISLPVALQELLEIFVTKHLVFMEDEQKRSADK